MPDINGIPYVESTDLVSGYPSVSQSLAQEVSDQLASKLDLAGGKILQIVRATDSTARTTTSTSFTDVTGMSVTITPQKSDSALIILSTCSHALTRGADGVTRGSLRLADSSDNALSGSENNLQGNGNATRSFQNYTTLVGYVTPATTSAVTYKLQFRIQDTGVTHTIQNAATTGQIYAIEVSA